MKIATLGIITWLIMNSALADLRFPALFSDGMVLQRDQKVAVWGWADPCAEVTVSFAGQEQSAKAGPDGKFMVHLEKMDASAEPRILKVVSGTDMAEVKNVLVGEVWLCSGQSNMHMAVKNAKNYHAEKAEANYPLLRMFSTELKTSSAAQEDCGGSWVICSPDSVGEFSAAAYFFGREIYRDLHVPVGLLRSAWGGTPIEAWSPMESLKQVSSAMTYKNEMDRLAETFDEASAQEHNAMIWADYNRKVELAKTNKTKWPSWPEEKIHPQKSHRYPANLYNAMIHPLVPYGIRGAVWYQGENNAKTIKGAVIYRDLLENMVSEWRKDWGFDFPFYAVQLVNFRKPSQGPVEDTPWVFLRDSILKFSKEVSNAGMAVGIDVGEANDIHPKNKQAIGYRLARQALAHTYKKNVVAGGPIYRSMKKDGNRIIVKFSDIGSGLEGQGGEPLKWFAIAGADQRFVAAEAVIVDDTVVVSAESVPDPAAVRYAWADNPVGCNLFNREGFPASPFRTDDWPSAGKADANLSFPMSKNEFIKMNRTWSEHPRKGWNFNPEKTSAKFDEFDRNSDGELSREEWDSRNN